jgi:hypothetical protein
MSCRPPFKIRRGQWSPSDKSTDHSRDRRRGIYRFALQQSVGYCRLGPDAPLTEAQAPNRGIGLKADAAAAIARFPWRRFGKLSFRPANPSTEAMLVRAASGDAFGVGYRELSAHQLAEGVAFPGWRGSGFRNLLG